MSELINNREVMEDTNKEKRQAVLKDIIMQLHDGKDPKEVKDQFAKLIDGVSASEISEMEAGLIKDGMPVEEIQRLCDVHAEIFKGSIEEIHTETKEEEKIGHPVRVLKEENFAIEDLLKNNILPKVDAYVENENEEIKNSIIGDVNLLFDIEKHYSRKENILFPYMEKYNITAPPKVMWGVDDEIRGELKAFKAYLLEGEIHPKELKNKAEALSTRIIDMIFKEESIMVPMLLDVLTEDEWLKIAEDSEEIGYCLVAPTQKWRPERENVEEKAKEETHGGPAGYVKFDTGILKVEELERILNTLPFDITFIDKDDIVKYFSQPEERFFPRTKSVIGRTVQNCHPHSSVNTVEKILDDFKSGKKDSESFWIKLRGEYIYIRYFAVRDENKNYMGTLEVSQNIRPIQEITGEKRLLSE
ncbi:hypothetical protein SAMN05660462_00982 [Proteiniborus ethanoligenes]|uniref:PAC domain-containing protein n=1 Tax=Proteiniborus ethanoligenes TaxID=415015 RepID=A0A1H3MZH8_9FIRM|nr:DUF438 domain-containing protein [Proteiniborus ethanoligenes]TAH63994.1 MAG: DUF438 domain-containing protein [Gottschalkiaceae bacterium]SDY81920.1 hypothetical protein SAMN05660462_00982 [Proteiniborus ethanoligenes]